MASTSTIDNLTAGAIREALASAAAGRLNQACDIGERALAQGGDAPALHAMLGMLHCRSGDLEKGVEHLRRARDLRPTDPVVARNLASTLSQLGRYSEALEIITDELVESDKSLQLLKLRGFLAQMADDFAVATGSYEQVVAASPDDWESWNNLGNARRAQDDFEGAVAAIRRAVELNSLSPPVRLNFATALHQAGQFAEAEEQLRKMADDFPSDPKPLRELFGLRREQFREEEALEAIEEAVRRDPQDVELALGLASHRLMLLRHADAETAYRRVLEIEPGNKLAYLGVATAYELTNRTSELAAWVGEAEQAGVEADALNFIRAFDHRRAKRYAEGLEALRQVPEELETARRYHLYGQLLEGVKDYDGAFAAYERMNDIGRADPSLPEERAAAYRAGVARQLEAMTPDWAASWIPLPEDDRPSPVFLVGFPRSGTTLLDTILMSHPQVEVLEEEPTVKNAFDALGGFERLPDASPKSLKEALDVYFETARSRTSLAPGHLLIDKNPLAMNNLPAIRRLFPDARVILALRHPCDVVLSCFVTNFKLNDGMANFLRLDTAAELYDLSFRYFERARELLKPPVHTIVYENIVEDRDRELRPLFEFLGLDWHDSVLDHETTARGRGHIKTASYAQVVEPIYKRSAGRWQNYRKHLEPVIPVLRPWAEKFGYEI
jgi:tetratricopeptide (TPR) repeat protein